VAPASGRDILAPSVRLGRVVGIPIGLHYSWFIIAALITSSLSGQFRLEHPEWATALVWATSAITAALFFVTLLAHELSHAVVAMARGLPVRSITLFALGGIAQIEKEANSAKTEFLVAIAGPICSFAIGFGCIAVAQALGWSPRNDTSGLLGGVLGWLGSINVLLAAFNLIPGYPLDGGRVLRAILWALYGNMARATRHAARAGQFVGGLFIMTGLLQAFAGAGFGGLWLAFIGWFLLMAARANYAQAAMAETLRDVRVADIMVNDCETVDAGTHVQALVEEHFLRTGRRCVMVARDGQVIGLVTPHEVRSVDRGRWMAMTAGDVMRPLEGLRTVTPETPATDAFITMARDDVNQLPVVVGGRLEGIVSRSQILQLLQSRSELRA
jgi:Zn-dependent protease